MYEIDFKEFGKYKGIVYSNSYESPIYYLKEIENVFKKEQIHNGVVLFDTLLSKGNVSNRFIEGVLENGHFNNKYFKTITVDKESEIRKIASDFYRTSDINLNNSLLTLAQKNIITAGYCL